MILRTLFISAKKAGQQEAAINKIANMCPSHFHTSVGQLQYVLGSYTNVGEMFCSILLRKMETLEAI